MTCAEKTRRLISKTGAGVWAAMAACALLCLLLLASGKNEGEAKTDKEIRLERVMEKIEGAGDTDVMIAEENGCVTGVLVVAQGAGDIAVRLRLQNAVKTLLDVENEKINVMPMEGAEYGQN